jgi:L-aspartate oxidase
MTALASHGFDPAHDPIPVSPAAHYTMGGIVTDLDGRTGVPGLYAAGECACTGVHGANRLASNSLLECLVFGRRAALAALGESPVTGSVPPTRPEATWPVVTPEVREAMWRDAGLIRDAAGLERLARTRHPLARLIAKSALARRESRGAHFRSDFPTEDDAFRRHVVLTRGEEPRLEAWS